MIWYVLFGFFAAVGVLFLLWLILGAFLPGRSPCIVAVRCHSECEKALLRRYRWLRELGLICYPIVLVGSEIPIDEQLEIMSHYSGVSFQTPEQWLRDTEERLEKHG